MTRDEFLRAGGCPHCWPSDGRVFDRAEWPEQVQSHVLPRQLDEAIRVRRSIRVDTSGVRHDPKWTFHGDDPVASGDLRQLPASVGWLGIDTESWLRRFGVVPDASLWPDESRNPWR